MVVEEYKKKRKINMKKRRDFLDNNYTKKELISNTYRTSFNKSDTKERIIDLIIQREFGSLRMGNDKLNPKKII